VALKDVFKSGVFMKETYFYTQSSVCSYRFIVAKYHWFLLFF